MFEMRISKAKKGLLACGILSAVCVLFSLTARAQETHSPKSGTNKIAAKTSAAKPAKSTAAAANVSKPKHVVATRLPAKVANGKKAQSPAEKPRAAAPTSGDSLSWTKSTSSWTRTLRASDNPQTPGFSEALALAVDGQYLVVPLSFVSEVWLARPGAHFYIDEPKQEAFLVDLDMVSNMALLKTEAPLIPSYYRSQIRLDSPLQDEPLLVLASRDWIRTGARFLRSKNDGSYARYQIAFFNGDFATSRFVFDRAGRLVAVASGADGADRAWSGAARSLFELLRRQDGPHPASVSTTEQRRRQLFYWQERWAKALVPTRANLALHSLDCQAYVASIAEQSLATQVRSVRALDCEGRFPLQLGAGYTTGVRLWTGEAALRSGDEAMSTKLVQAFSADAFADLAKSAALVNLMTVPDCSDSSVSNQKGQSVQVRFCTTALKVEPGLSDTAISVSSMEPGAKAYFAVARLKGFDQMNTKKVIEALVENVRSLK